MRAKALLAPTLLMLSLLVAAPARSDAWLIHIEGAIGPATADHMVRSLERAQEASAEFVILRIDTPGGLDTAMRDMIKAVLASNIPVVAHVSPSGARAASAGTYLLYASHLAAMAPGTNLGAATPVQIATPSLPAMRDHGDDGAEDDATAMENKIVNDAVAYIRSLAQLRGRNAGWAEVAVREGASLSSEDALAEGVIELMAENTPDLLRELDGRVIALGEGEYRFQTNGLVVHEQVLDWRSEFLGVITNPNVAYILMLVGIYGLLLEFYNPGVGLPGVVGAICLFLALYAFQALPVNYAGMALILLGIALLTAEAFVPSFGVLGLGGVGAFVMGSIMLMDTELPAYQLALPTILGVAVFSVALLVFALGMIVRARRQAVVSGLEHLAGAVGIVETVEQGAAMVRLEGELWTVDCDEPLAPRDQVVVRSIDGLTLQVSRRQQV